jgi:hypothetical protein
MTNLTFNVVNFSEMKQKTSNKNEPEISEINVDDLLSQLSKANEATPEGGSKKRRALEQQALISTRVSAQTGSRNQNGAGSANSDARRILSVAPDATPPNVSSEEDLDDGVGVLSKSQKLRLRLQRKIQDRKIIGREGESISEEENSHADGKKPKSSKPRRNYVERVSSQARAGKASCGWKDLACVLMVLLLIAATAFMKFQEEVFGSIEHMRLESDADADFYEILGVPHSASPKDIKRAYRNKVIEVHPDQHPGCEDCDLKFIAATKAYETLIDSEKRLIYDQTRGSYEPILSDYSVSLTSFNYVNLVSESSHVWVIQVFDDLDPYSKHFASRWDAVAGSDISRFVKFGRVNARRDSAVLSLLPMRARTFPTVIMFSRDSMPSIFSIADTSSKALKKWISTETPSHIGETNSENVFEITITAKSESLALKAASVRFGRVFDFQFAPSQLPVTQISLKDKRSGNQLIATHIGGADLSSAIEAIKEKLVIPLNRKNVHDVCGSEGAEFLLVCVGTTNTNEPLLEEPISHGGEVILQPVVMPKNAPMVLDFQGSRVANISAETLLSEVYLDDVRFVPMDREAYLNKYMPLGLLDHIQQYRTLVASAVLLAIVFVLGTQVGPVQITIAVTFLSVLIGALPYLQNVIAYIRSVV